MGDHHRITLGSCTVYVLDRVATIFTQNVLRKDFKAAYNYCLRDDDIDKVQWSENDITFMKPKRLRDGLLVKCIHVSDEESKYSEEINTRA